MERPLANKSVDELLKILNDVFSALIRDYGHRDEGYCLGCDDEPFDALDEIKRRFDERPKWPIELHEQYMRLLDERDRLQEELDRK